MIGLGLRQPSERFGQPLVLEDHAAGNEITALGWFVLTQTEQHFVAWVTDDQVNGNKRRETDHRVDFGVTEQVRGHLVALIEGRRRRRQ